MLYYEMASIYMTSQSQKGIALSSSEAEYMALSDAAKLVSWICQVVNELSIKQRSIVIHQDNNGAIEWAEEGSARHFYRRKHIDILHHFVMRMIAENLIRIKRIRTQHMLVDILTKPLGPNVLITAVEKLDIFAVANGTL